MKVKIKITEGGYNVALVDAKGKEHIQKWRRMPCGFQTTKDSVNFKNFEITDKLKDAINFISGLDNISDALETENSDLPADDDKNFTIDGHKLKRGNTYYSIAVVAGTWEHCPTRLTYPQDWHMTPNDDIFYSIDNCWTHCKKLNKRINSNRNEK